MPFSNDDILILTGSFGFSDAAVELEMSPLEVDGIGMRLRFAVPMRKEILQSAFSASKYDVLKLIEGIDRMDTLNCGLADFISSSDLATMQVAFFPRDVESLAISAHVRRKDGDDIDVHGQRIVGYELSFQGFKVTRTYLQEIARFLRTFVRRYFADS